MRTEQWPHKEKLGKVNRWCWLSCSRQPPNAFARTPVLCIVTYSLFKLVFDPVSGPAGLYRMNEITISALATEGKPSRNMIASGTMRRRISMTHHGVDHDDRRTVSHRSARRHVARRT